MIVRETILIRENVNQAKSVLRKNNIPETDRRYVELKEMLEKRNKLGYIGVFTKWMAAGSPIQELKELFELIQTTNVKKIPPIDTFQTAEQMYDTIRSLETTTKADNLISRIPSRARAVLDTPELRNFINALDEKNLEYVKSYFLGYSGGFVNSQYKNPEDFFPSLEAYVENLNSDWNLTKVLPQVQKFDDVKIIYKSPELLVFTISDYETSKELCSKEFCIATSKHYFDTYVHTFSNQFLIYDFTKKPSDVRSIIGATLEPNNKGEEINIKEMMFRNNHDYYYPNHPQPTGYGHGKKHEPAIHIKKYMEELLKEIEPNV